MNIRPARRLDGVRRTLIRRIFDSAPADAINLGLGEPDSPTPPPLALAGVAAIVEGRTGYTSTAGDFELREAVAGRYPAIAGGAGEVLITVGSQEAVFVSCLSLLDPGSEMLYPDPGYPAYPTVARLVGARGVPYPLRAERGFRLMARDVLDRLTPRTRVVVLNVPSNPTGAGFDEGELPLLVGELARRSVPWLSDEVYGALTFEPMTMPGELNPSGGLTVSGLSKEMSMTGWRVGWIVGPEAIIARIVAAQQYLVTCASSVSQRAALAAFTPEGRAEAARYLTRLRDRRGLMAEELSRIPEIGVRMPQGGFYFFVDVAAYGPAEEVARRILDEAKVITIPGTAFGEEADGYLRLSFAADERQIVEGIAGMRRVLS